MEFIWRPEHLRNLSVCSHQSSPKETQKSYLLLNSSFLRRPRRFNGVRVAAEVSDANARRLRKQEIMRKERKVKHGRDAFQSGAERTSNADGR